MEDAAIVDLFLAREESAIRYTAEKYGARLRGIAQGILNDRTAAEECENDAYWEAWRRIPPHEPRDYLFAFLGRIIRHLAIDVFRRKNSAKRRASQYALCLADAHQPASLCQRQDRHPHHRLRRLQKGCRRLCLAQLWQRRLRQQQGRLARRMVVRHRLPSAVPPHLQVQRYAQSVGCHLSALCLPSA